MDIRYLGGFVGTEAAQDRCLNKTVEVWKSLVAIMARVVCKHLQTDYMGLQKSVQKEWYFVQSVTLDIEAVLYTVEYAL